MPTYEYKCDACGHKFEKFQSIKASPVRKCPKCGKLKVHRLLGMGAGVIFKGSGFYSTDYRSESYKSAAKADSGSAGATKPDSDAGKSGDSKPAGDTSSAGSAKEPAPAPKEPSAGESSGESSRSRKKK